MSALRMLANICKRLKITLNAKFAINKNNLRSISVLIILSGCPSLPLSLLGLHCHLSLSFAIVTILQSEAILRCVVTAALINVMGHIGQVLTSKYCLKTCIRLFNI